MNKLKLCKYIYNKKVNSNNKCFFVFTFFNVNSTLIDVLKMLLEENTYNFSRFKINDKFNIVNFYLEFEIENYFEEKEDLFEFFKEEDFKFCLTAVYNNSNYLEPHFFENMILQENDDNTEIYIEILFFVFISIISISVHYKKFVYLTNNIFIINENFIKYQCLQYIKPHLN